jgi:hypothetical protein
MPPIERYVVECRISPSRFEDNTSHAQQNDVVVFSYSFDEELRDPIVLSDITWNALNDASEKVQDVRLEVDEIKISQGSVVITVFITGITLIVSDGSLVGIAAGALATRATAWLLDKFVGGAIGRLGKQLVEGIGQRISHNLQWSQKICKPTEIVQARAEQIAEEHRNRAAILRGPNKGSILLCNKM